jgi:hypothetical protein
MRIKSVNEHTRLQGREAALCACVSIMARRLAGTNRLSWRGAQSALSENLRRKDKSTAILSGLRLSSASLPAWAGPAASWLAGRPSQCEHSERGRRK